MRARSLWLLIFSVGTLMLGCETGGGRRVGLPSLLKTPEMERGFQAAERLFYAKKFAEAKEVYRGFLTQFPYNALTPKANFRLGEIYFHEGDLRRALSFYKRSIARGIDPEWGGMSIYKQAVATSRLGELKRVFAVLDQMPREGVEAKVGVRAGSLRVSTAKKLDNRPEEIKGYLELVDAYGGLPPSEAKIGDLNWIISEGKVREELRDWVTSEGESEGEEGKPHRWKKWLERFEGKPSGSYLIWRLARFYHRKGDYEEAALWAGRYLAGYPKQEYASEARALAAEVSKRGEGVGEGGRLAVGVLLPLTGKFAVYGESVLHGLECAAGIFAPCREDLGLNLRIRDTQGEARVAQKAVEEYGREGDVVAVIGPLPQSEVDLAAAAAEAAALPLVSLSQKPDLAKAGEFVFRNFLTVADQVATVVKHACEEKRWKRLAILYPQGGEEYRKRFEEEVGRCGGKVVAQGSYPPGKRDLTEAVRTLKFSVVEQKADESVPFDALFVPDVYRRVPDLVAALRHLNMTGVHLLGGAGWDHPDLAKVGPEIEGAVFVNGFFAKGSNFATRDFVSTFQAAYGIEPTLLEAYAYDTLRLLGEVLKDHPNASRLDLRGFLAEKRNFAGVTGNISFDEDGDARRRLTLLTVENGEIREIR